MYVCKFHPVAEAPIGNSIEAGLDVQVAVPNKSFRLGHIIYVLPSAGFGIRDIQVVNHYQQQYWSRFVPWGMPAVIGSQTEVKPANLTHCRWLVRKLIIHSIEYVETPKSRSFSNSTLYPM